MPYFCCIKYGSKKQDDIEKKKLACDSLERFLFCYKIIKVLQLNHSQKIVLIVGRTLIEPTHES